MLINGSSDSGSSGSCSSGSGTAVVVVEGLVAAVTVVAIRESAGCVIDRTHD